MPNLVDLKGIRQGFWFFNARYQHPYILAYTVTLARHLTAGTIVRVHIGKGLGTATLAPKVDGEEQERQEDTNEK